MNSPLQSLGRYFAFCSSVPLREIWLTQRFEWDPYDSAIDPEARLISSRTMQWSRYDASVPPYFDGAVIPSKPAQPTAFSFNVSLCIRCHGQNLNNQN